MYSLLVRIYSTARSRIRLLIALPSRALNGVKRRRRGEKEEDYKSGTSSPMYAILAMATDPRTTPAAGTPQLGTSPLPPPQAVVVAFDATRDHSEDQIKIALDAVLMRGDILRGGDALLVLGVLHAVTNPMGYQTKACTDSFAGPSSRYLEEQVSKTADLYEARLRRSAERLRNVGVSVTLKIAAGTPAKTVMLQEVNSSKAAWVILDRHFRRDFKFYEKRIACKVAIFQDNLSVRIVKSFYTNPSSKSAAEEKTLHTVIRSFETNPRMSEAGSTSIMSSAASYFASLSIHDVSSVLGSSMLSTTQSVSVRSLNLLPSDETESISNGKVAQENIVFHYDSLERPVLCAGCGLRSVLYIKESMKFPFAEIQAATSHFSNENLLGEGGFGHVYKGQLKDGQVIAAKLRKEASSQGYSEFFSEVQVLSFVRHRNIVMLLGYCCKESYNILVYEYICNQSLEWHLFDKSANLLEWHKRHAVALGIAKGLRFLHEECRAGPIIHRDLRPSNVLLTHDFVPMLGDFGLAKWKSSNASFQTRILGQSGYLAPEYAEYGVVSVRTDVYAFGIVLFQLMSGRRVLEEEQGQLTHILQWAEPLIESLALHELIDKRIGESYDTQGLYNLARAAYLCVRTNPEMRPSMGEVVRFLEAENDHVRDLSLQFIPHFTK